MIRSRVLTYGFRLFFGFAVFAFFGSFVFAIGSSIDTSDQGLVDNVLGPLTAGWKGGIGSHLGYVVLLGTSAVAGFIAAMLIAFRDADPDAQAQIVHTEQVPLTRAPSGASYAPIVGGMVAVGAIVGLVGEPRVFQASLIAALMIAFVWTVRAWAERATGDDETNRELYHRIIDPLRVPVIGILVIGFVVLGLSRALLAVDKVSSIVIFGGAATLFFIAAALLSARPKIPRGAITVLLLVGGVAILGAAIAGLIAGERDFEHHGSDHEGEEVEGEGALAPTAPLVLITAAGADA